MSVTSLVVDIAPHAREIIKNGLHVFEMGENLLQNGILYFVFRLSQSSEIAFESLIYYDEKLTFSFVFLRWSLKLMA